MSKAELFTAGVKVVFEELAKRADAGDEASLMFLHNTSADKLQRVQDMGGMPMPSIAITDKDIPFENFGDITLVGKPESFDPKSSSLNQAFSADAYTVRAPRPVRIAKKGAGKRFQELYGADAKDLDVYADDTAANVWDLEKKGDVREDKYDQVVRWFDDRSGPIFLKDKGIPFNKESRQDIDEKLQPFRQSGEFKQWAEGAVDDLFEEGEYFITNPNRDYYTQKAKLSPYTADEITKVMKRSAGRGGEGGMSTSSPGAVRAAYSEKLTSLDAMRKRREQLSGDISIEKGEIENLLFDLGDALKPYYQYSADGFMYLNAVSEFLIGGATKGLRRSGEFVGFENIPPDLMKELEGFQQILKKAPTEYFESKPKRVVQLNEFGGAIVPEDTSQRTIDLLTRQGLEIERYTDDAQRLEAREKFKNLLFQLSPVAVTTVLAGIAAGAPGRAEAGPITVGRNVAAELAKRADVVAEYAASNPKAFLKIQKQVGKTDIEKQYVKVRAKQIASEKHHQDRVELENRPKKKPPFLHDQSKTRDILNELGFRPNGESVSKNFETGLPGSLSSYYEHPVTKASVRVSDHGPVYQRSYRNVMIHPDSFSSDLEIEQALRSAAKKADAGPLSAGTNVLTELAKRANAGDTVARQVIDVEAARLTKQGFPEDTAMRIATGELPMDSASRNARAVEQGYDPFETWYHGTADDITAFDPAKSQSRDFGHAGKGTYVASHPGIARAYANTAAGSADANIMPLRTSANNPLRISLEQKQLLGQAGPSATAKLQQQAISEGFDSVEVIMPNGEILEKVIFDPANIRSTNAAFDPANKGKSALLGGLGGAAVVGGSMTPEEAQAGQGGGLVPFDPAIHTPQDLGLGEPGSVSTEYIATVDAPDGSVMLIPTIWWDAEGNPKLFEREDTDKAIELAIDYEQSTGKQFPRFPAGAYAEADDYAISRSKAGGASQTPLARDTTTGMGGMGVQSAPVTQDEEAIIAAQQPAPTGADLMQQANDDFLSGIFNQPGSFFNPETYDVIGDTARGAFDATTGFLGDMEQMLVGGIMQGIGGATTWEDALKMIGGGLGQEIINAPEGRFGRFEEGIKNYDPAFITSGEVGQVPGMIPSFGAQDEERTKRAKMLGKFFSPI